MGPPFAWSRLQDAIERYAREQERLQEQRDKERKARPPSEAEKRAIRAMDNAIAREIRERNRRS
jgi:hypothetical protein